MALYPNRITVQLDEDSIALLKEVQEVSGMTPPQTIAKLWPSHMADLWEYVTWLKQLPPGPSRLRSLGRAMLQSYGPNTLVQNIKAIDPTYVTDAEKFAQGLKDVK